MKVIKIKKYKCLRCSHQWQPRKKGLPKVCPKCFSAYWKTSRIKK